MKTAIAIFCKTPGLSPIKTRLAVTIGREKAEEFYRLSIAVIEETILQTINGCGQTVDAYWAVAEKSAFNHPLWKTFECIWTGEGGLGDRIHNIFEELLPAYEQVIIIGSDSPQITSEYLSNAILSLSGDHTDGVIGPCRDGGFVLFGTKSLIPRAVWADTSYSREDTLQQITQQLDRISYQYRYIRGLGDVDQYEDLFRLAQDYNSMGAGIQPSQKRILYWLNSNITKQIRM